MIQAILLINNQIIVAQTLPEIDSESGESQFNLMYPYLFTFDGDKFNLTPWLSEVNNSTEKIIVYPDKIITVIEPKPEILNLYKKLVLFDQNTVIKEEKIKVVTPKVVNTDDKLDKMTIQIDQNDIDEIFIDEDE